MDDMNCYKEISEELLGCLKSNLTSFKAAIESPEIKSSGMFTDIIFNTKSGRHTFQARHIQLLSEKIIKDIAVDTFMLCQSVAEGTLVENKFTMVLVFDAEFAHTQQTREDASKIIPTFDAFTNNLYPIKHIMMFEYAKNGLFPYCP
jgi:hypothetical protein